MHLYASAAVAMSFDFSYSRAQNLFFFGAGLSTKENWLVRKLHKQGLIQEQKISIASNEILSNKRHNHSLVMSYDN